MLKRLKSFIMSLKLMKKAFKLIFVQYSIDFIDICGFQILDAYRKLVYV